MSSLLRLKNCWTSSSDILEGRVSAPMKRWANVTVTPFRESKPQIYLVGYLANPYLLGAHPGAGGWSEATVSICWKDTITP